MSVMAKRKKSNRPPPSAEQQEACRAWAARLKSLRARLGISQREAAERAGLPLRTWISWENRQHVPPALSVRLLESIFPDL